MKRRCLINIIFLVLIPFTYSCVSKTGEQTELKEQDSLADGAGSVATGQTEYNKYCLACHQTDGNGVRGQFPPLAGNELVTNHPDSLIRIVLFGLEGPITVNGLQYNQLMPAQDYLTDQQIADVLTYIRNAWGNQAPAIKSEQVKILRDTVQRKTQP